MVTRSQSACQDTVQYLHTILQRRQKKICLTNEARLTHDGYNNKINSHSLVQQNALDAGKRRILPCNMP